MRLTHERLMKKATMTNSRRLSFFFTALDHQLTIYVDISERIIREDIFTSIHVDEYIMEVRDTKRGMEELTADIPNVSPAIKIGSRRFVRREKLLKWLEAHEKGGSL